MGAAWGWEPREAGSRVGGAVSHVGLCLLLEPVVQRTSLQGLPCPTQFMLVACRDFH